MVGAGDYPINPVFHIPDTQFKSGIGGVKHKVKYKKSGADAIADVPPPSPQQMADALAAAKLAVANGTATPDEILYVKNNTPATPAIAFTPGTTTAPVTTPTAPKLIMGMTYKKAGVVGAILAAIVIGLVALSD